MIANKDQSKKKKKNCSFCADKVEFVDFKDVHKLKRFLSERGKILPRRITGTCAEHQRQVARAIKRAREAALIDYIFEG